ncbi:MAG: AraC family transcriptional regulator [Hyphomonadaceae bacterium]|nr:AraC family transcriptional regulator [Hyphomonadaceae bacterium]
MTAAFFIRPAPSSISAFVRELWLLRDDGALRAGLPKPYVELVFNLAGVHWWRPELNACEQRFDHAWVTPVQDAPRYARADGVRVLIGARIEPVAAATLFGPIGAGVGQAPPHLETLMGAWGADTLSALRAATSEEQVFSILGRRLENAFSRGKISTRCRDEPAVGPLTELGASARTLRRRYKDQVGLSPKRLARLRRLDRVLRDLAEGGAALAQVAQAHGFFDQAHMTREILKLTGVTPGQLRRRSQGTPPHMAPCGMAKKYNK